MDNQHCSLSSMEKNIMIEIYEIQFVQFPQIFQFSSKSVITVIARTNSFKDLGVIFDTKLNFHDHICNMTFSAFKLLGYCIRNSF